MEKEFKFTKSLPIPEVEKIVDTVLYGERRYWDFQFPFYHHIEPKLFVVTENAVYVFELTKT